MHAVAVRRDNVVQQSPEEKCSAVCEKYVDIQLLRDEKTVRPNNPAGFGDGEFIELCYALWGLNADVEYFNLYNTAVTHRALEEIARHFYLKDEISINVSNTAVTDEGMRHLAKFAELNHLFLAHTAVTDQGVAELSPLHHIGILDLSHCHVTAKSEPIFKNVHGVNLIGTGIPFEQVVEFTRWNAYTHFNTELRQVHDEVRVFG